MRDMNEERNDIWKALAAPLPAESILWRQQGKPKARNNGGFAAPFVAYTDAQVVRDRLDSVVPGEWDLSIDLLPTPAHFDGEEAGEPFNFKARLSILGVHREDVGSGKDYKQASTDAFKRAAVRFGIAHELYTDYEVVWVAMDGDGKYAKPIENPGDVWARKSGAAPQSMSLADVKREFDADEVPTDNGTGAADFGPLATAEPNCPKCGGRTWDNRLTKRNPKAPDYKCRDRACDGVIWPEKATA